MSDIQSSIRPIQQVLAVATAVSGGDLEAAILWYRNEPLALFDCWTAEPLVAEGRATDVLSLLEPFQAGFIR
ncbi:hypothetical protein [Variovorax paradoxus]|uniref:hypothetical protein n=1 Tax=Variovorax paradoxus TaxID=34073 RepID=UPI0027852773|nr:hypothetical protein [Variovorax paradoxus]MDP9932843.1 hypothetical protein [Variovorax paradoxus]